MHKILCLICVCAHTHIHKHMIYTYVYSCVHKDIYTHTYVHIATVNYLMNIYILTKNIGSGFRKYLNLYIQNFIVFTYKNFSVTLFFKSILASFNKIHQLNYQIAEKWFNMATYVPPNLMKENRNKPQFSSNYIIRFSQHIGGCKLHSRALSLSGELF